MDLTIYTLTHKHFTKPDDNMYVPLQVGTAINSPLGISGTIQEIIYRLLTVIIVNLQDYTGYGKMCMILIMLEHAITEDFLLMRTSIL